MELEQRVKALEQEVEILKNQIQSTLLDIQQHLLTNSYPSLRAEENTADNQPNQPPSPVARPQQSPNGDNGGRDDAYEAPVVRKMSLDAPKAQPDEMIVPTQRRTANLPLIEDDEEDTYEAPVVRRVSLNAAHPEPEEAVSQRRPVSSDYTDNDEDESPAPPVRKVAPRERAASSSSRRKVKPVVNTPEAPRAQNVTPVDSQQTRPTVRASERQRLMSASSAASAPSVTPATPAPQRPVVQSHVQTAPLNAPQKPAAEQAPVDTSKKLVLKLIAGVQNAGAGIGWRKRNG